MDKNHLYYPKIFFALLFFLVFLPMQLHAANIEGMTVYNSPVPIANKTIITGSVEGNFGMTILSLLAQLVHIEVSFFWEIKLYRQIDYLPDEKVGEYKYETYIFYDQFNQYYTAEVVISDTGEKVTKSNLTWEDTEYIIRNLGKISGYDGVSLSHEVQEDKLSNKYYIKAQVEADIPFGPNDKTDWWDGSNQNAFFSFSPPEPSIPNNVVASTGTFEGSIILRWDASPNANGYYIFYDEDNDNPPFTPSKNGNPSSGDDVGDVSEVTISDLTPGQKYYLAIESYNNSMYSLPSNQVSGIAKGYTINSIQILGPDEVNENSSEQYICKVKWSNGVETGVTQVATWSVSSSLYASISSGNLTTSTITSDKTISITASYEGESTTQTVTIKDLSPYTLSYIQISGPPEVNENSSAQYTCKAYYEDGSSKFITSSSTWSIDTSYASINSSGMLTTMSVVGDKQREIAASYEGEPDTFIVTIKDVSSPVVISGRVTDADGNGFHYVKLYSGSYKTYTNENGYYELTVPSGWSGTVYLIYDYGYEFSPSFSEYENVSINLQDEDYIITENPPLISGYVKSASGVGIPNVSVKIYTVNFLYFYVTTDENGYYAARLYEWAKWSGRVTPEKTGRDFDPIFRDYDNVTSPSDNQNFTIYPLISGHVIDSAGNGVHDVRLIFSNDGGGTLSDENGYYYKQLPINWSGTVTASELGWTFDPPHRDFSNLTSDQIEQDFLGTDRYVDISGQIMWPNGYPGEGVRVYFINEDGTELGYYYTYSFGHYNMRVPQGWSGGVIPKESGHHFSPYFRDYNNVTSDLSNQDYIISLWEAGLTIISGYVTDWEGNGIEGVALSFSDGGGTVLTDINGYYNQTWTTSYAWKGQVTPSKAGYYFTPSYMDYPLNTNGIHTSQNYVSSVYVSGYVHNSLGEGIPEVTLFFDNGGGIVVSDETGYYSQYVPSGWSGTVSAEKSNYHFSPDSTQYANLVSSKSDQNYLGQSYFTISGSIADLYGNAVVGLKLDFSGGAGTTFTDEDGFYSHEVPEGWSGYAIPSVSDIIYCEPFSLHYNNINSNYSNQDFIVYTPLMISGRVRASDGTALKGVSLSFSGQTGVAVTDEIGYYSHYVPYQWSGTVTPQKYGWYFDPLQLNYSNVASNTTDQNYSGKRIRTLIIRSLNPEEDIDIEVDPLDLELNGPGTTNNNGLIRKYIDSVAVAITAPLTFQKDGTDYIFSGWTINGLSYDQEQLTVNFYLIEDATAVVSYQTVQRTVTVESLPCTGVNITGTLAGETPYTANVDDNSTVKLIAPDPFKEWLKNGASFAAEYEIEIEINTNDTYTVVFNYGDMNGDGNINLIDAILALQISAQIEPASPIYKGVDVNCDEKIGLEEVIYILQEVSGLR